MQTAIIIEFKYSWLISLWNGKKILFIIIFFKIKFCNYSRYGVCSSVWVHATPGLLNKTFILYREHKHHILWPLTFSCGGMSQKFYKTFSSGFLFWNVFMMIIPKMNIELQNRKVAIILLSTIDAVGYLYILFILYPSQLHFSQRQTVILQVILLHLNYVLNFESFPCR